MIQNLTLHDFYFNYNTVFIFHDYFISYSEANKCRRKKSLNLEYIT